MSAIDRLRLRADDIGEWADMPPTMTVREIVDAQQELRLLLADVDARAARGIEAA